MKRKIMLGLFIAGVIAAGTVPLSASADPWAYDLSHRSAQSVTRITEHSAGQNGTGHTSAAAPNGPLDPTMAAAIRASSNGGNDASSSTAAAVPAVASSGFDWSDAWIGVAITIGATVLAVGAGLLVRRSRTRLASLQR